MVKSGQMSVVFNTDPGPPLMTKMKDFTRLGIPAMICTITLYFQEITNLYFVAKLGETELIAAIGLANTIQNCFGLGIALGVN